MKKELRSIGVCLSKNDGNVLSACCSCPAGNSEYCNHIMALLFEIANYALKGHVTVPEEVSCTSGLRQWGIPSSHKKFHEPIMNTTVAKLGSNRGIKPTLYDPRINANKFNFHTRVKNLKAELEKKDKRIGFAHSINNNNNYNYIPTKYGKFEIGSTLSHQLRPFKHDLK